MRTPSQRYGVRSRKRQRLRKFRPGPGFIRSMQRAAVNIYKTDNSFEMLVFAPGRIKEHFHLDVNGNELTVSYSTTRRFSPPGMGVAGIQPWWIQKNFHSG